MINDRKKIILIFVILILIQAVYSFLVPSYQVDSSYWKTFEQLNFYKGYSFNSFDNSLFNIIRPLISNYHMNLDGGGYLLLAHDFPQHYFEGHNTFLSRPLYPFLVFVISRPLHLISNSYSLTFAAGIIFNLTLFFFTVFLFYLLVEKLISHKVAFWSSVLLIFSPFVHTWLVQPETNIFGIFEVVLSLYLLFSYANKPSLKKLIIFSLIVGILLLGKKLFAITFFILILAILYKRYKEGIIFFVIHLIPTALWFLWVTKVWHLNFYVDELSFGAGIWLFNLFYWPWHETLKKLFTVIPNFITSIIYGFLLIPLIFSLIGFSSISFKRKNIIILAFVFSFFLLFFITDIYWPRYGFLIFPVIYPAAVLGIEKSSLFLERKTFFPGKVFFALVVSLIIVISQLNIYYFINYG